MIYQQLTPLKLWHTNGILKGSAGIPNLSVTRYEQDGETVTASSYRLTFRQRLKFLFCGRVHVCMFGVTHSPMAVGIGELFKIEALKEVKNGIQ